MSIKQPKIKITTENKCSFCKGAKCCQYVTQEIDTPKTKYDFEHLLWQVMHENVEVYKDTDKTWYLMMMTPCSNLQPDGRCGIYETRPQICRDYKNDWCEYDDPPENHWLLYFKDRESLNKYCKKRFKRWDR